VNRPNEKGVVEATVKFARLKFFVPVPSVGDLEALNARLGRAMRQDLSRRLRGQKAPQGSPAGRGSGGVSPLPEVPLDACRKELTRADRESLVRFEPNDYSVPGARFVRIAYAYHDVTVKGYVDRVEVCCADQVIARHARCWGASSKCSSRCTIWPLLWRKPGALGLGAALRRVGLAGVLRGAAGAAGAAVARRGGDAGVHPGAGAVGGALAGPIWRGPSSAPCATMP